MPTMVVVGLIAAVIGGRALWVVPLSFVTMMAAGGALGMAGFALQYVVAAVLVGLFAIFHGHAHGAEMPDSASGIQYGAGFVLATALLHCVGIRTGLLGDHHQARVAQAAGGVMAMQGSRCYPDCRGTELFKPIKQAIDRERPRPSETQGDEAGKIEQIRFIAWLTKVSAGSVEGLQLDRAKPVRQMDSKNRNKKNSGIKAPTKIIRPPTSSTTIVAKPKLKGTGSPMACNTLMKSSGPR